MPYHWTQVVNIKRDPFETSVGQQIKTLIGHRRHACRHPCTAYVYDWNLLPIGQVLWLKDLQSYIDFPPMQDPASYNLEQVMEQVKQMKHSSHDWRITTNGSGRPRASACLDSRFVMENISCCRPTHS